MAKQAHTNSLRLRDSNSYRLRSVKSGKFLSPQLAIKKRMLLRSIRKRFIGKHRVNKIAENGPPHVPIDSKHEGRRIMRWTYCRGVAGSLVSRIMTELEKNMRTSFYLRYSYSYRLRNIETGKLILYHKNLRCSPWLCSLEERTRAWLTTREEQRLTIDNVDRPTTKWAFDRFNSVETKAILDRQPLLGTASLPDWLRHKKGMYALDTYRDNLCLFRCLAVHKGAVSDRCTKRARELATEFYGATEELKDVPGTGLDQLKKVEEHFKLGIRVYEVTQNGDWHLTRQPARYDKLGTTPMTIGIYLSLIHI